MSEQFTFGGEIIWGPGNEYLGRAKGFTATRLYFEEN
jgi:hypothetical protein